MDVKRVIEILNSKKINNVYYDEKPVWIQNLNDNIAKIGFVNNHEEKDVYIEDLYEDNLYNKR